MDIDFAAKLNLPALEKGWVWLVGAGPGDSRTCHSFGTAGPVPGRLVLYDALVDETLLALSGARENLCRQARRGEKLQAGRDFRPAGQAGTKTTTACCGSKGGDPFVFGRGGEEAQALARAGVPFSHRARDHGGHRRAGLCRHPRHPSRHTNHAVTFITGHGADGKLTKLDWAAVSRGAPTLVLYMARKFAARFPRPCWRPAAAPMNPRDRRQCRPQGSAGDHHNAVGSAGGGRKCSGPGHSGHRRECCGWQVNSAGWRK